MEPEEIDPDSDVGQFLLLTAKEGAEHFRRQVLAELKNLQAGERRLMRGERDLTRRRILLERSHATAGCISAVERLTFPG